jgi:hypothetical protein
MQAVKTIISLHWMVRALQVEGLWHCSRASLLEGGLGQRQDASGRRGGKPRNS